jgi:hypothetical protein
MSVAQATDPLLATKTICTIRNHAIKPILTILMKKFIFAAALIAAFSLSHSQELHRFEQKNKYGFSDAAGKIVIRAIYDDANLFNEYGLAKVCLYDASINRKYGLIDKTGKIVVPIEYDYMGEEFHQGFIDVGKNEKYGFLNISGQTVIPLKYNFVHNFSEGLAAVYSGKKWGYINTAGAITIPIQYEKANEFHNGRAAVQSNEKWGFINISGSAVIPLIYDDAADFYGELSGVEKDYKWAVIDRNGNFISDFKYAGTGQTYGTDLIVVHSAESQGTGFLAPTTLRFGVVNRAGEEIVPLMYEWVTILTHELMQVKLKGNEGIVNSRNKVVLPINYSRDELSVWTERIPQGSYVVNGRRKLFSLEGNDIRIWKYDDMVFGNPLNAVEYNNKWGFINNKGQEVVATRYDSVGAFSEGMAQVAIGGKFGFVDSFGTEKITAKYTATTPFQGGYSWVILNNKIGVIDQNEKEFVPIKYDQILGFSENMAPVSRDQKWGFIDALGKEVIPAIYDQVGYFSEELAPVVLNNKVGFINKQGKMIIQPQFDTMVEGFSYGQAVMTKNGTQVRIDKTGNPLK